MKRFNLPAPAFFFIVATRAALGAGIGLLVADKLNRRKRRTLGASLVGVGVLTTIPALLTLFGPASRPERDVLVVAS